MTLCLPACGRVLTGEFSCSKRPVAGEGPSTQTNVSHRKHRVSVIFEAARRWRLSGPQVAVRGLGGIREGREAGRSGCRGGRRGGVSRWCLQSSGLDRGGRGGTGDALSSLSSSEHARAHKCAPSIKPPLRSVAMVTAFSLPPSLFLVPSCLLRSVSVRSSQQTQRKPTFDFPCGPAHCKWKPAAGRGGRRGQLRRARPCRANRDHHYNKVAFRKTAMR